MKRLLKTMKSYLHFEHLFAEFVAVFFDRTQVGTALLTANRLRGLWGGRRFFERRP